MIRLQLVRQRSTWLLLAAALLPYLNCLPNDFTLDDHGLIVENTAVAAADVGAFFTSDYWAGYDPSARSGLYRPVTLLSFAAEYALVGAVPWLYHVTNLLLHAAATLLVWRLFRRVTGAATAVWGAAIFAVLPGHSEAVIAIAGRADLLATVASLAALLCWSGPGTVAGALYFAVALLCKEQAAVVPALLVAVGWLQYRRGLRPLSGAGGLWQPLVVSGVVLGLYLLVRQFVLGGVASPHIEPLDNPLVALDGSARVLAALAVATRYAVLLMAPMRLSADYSYAAIEVDNMPAVWMVGGVLMVALLAASAWHFVRRPQAASFGLVWLSVCFAPFVNVLFPIGTILAERLTYAPSIGFALSLACIFGGASRWRRQLAGAGLVLLVLMGTRTAVRCADWRNESTLFAAVVEQYPASARGHKGLAKALRDAGDTKQAAAHYRRAIDIYPRFDTAHYNLGILLHEARRFDEALLHFDQACALRPDFADAHLNRGVTLFHMGRLHEALQATQRALLLRPDWDLAQQNLRDVRAIIDQLPAAAAPGGTDK